MSHSCYGNFKSNNLQLNLVNGWQRSRVGRTVVCGCNSRAFKTRSDCVACFEKKLTISLLGCAAGGADACSRPQWYWQ